MKLETQTEQLISETVTVYGLSPQIGVHALAQTANALAAQGTVFSVCPDITEDEETDTDIKNEDMQDTHETSASVSVQIAYPEYVFKSRIHKIEKLLKKACKKYNINLVAVQTYMNLSGESLRELVNYYKIDEEHELLVIYDDISLDVGQLRIRKKGSAGGHNGIKNIIANLGTDVFPRIKIGVGEKPKKYDLADYVLGHFSKEDRELMEEGYDRADHAVGMILNGEIEAAMNQYNRKVKPKEA